MGNRTKVMLRFHDVQITEWCVPQYVEITKYVPMCMSMQIFCYKSTRTCQRMSTQKYYLSIIASRVVHPALVFAIRTNNIICDDNIVLNGSWVQLIVYNGLN